MARLYHAYLMVWDNYQYDWKDVHGYYNSKSERAEAKRELVNFMRTKLGLPTGKPILSHSNNFWRTTKPSLFTAWLKKKSAVMYGVHPD